ncbi:MAG: hypothetical protein QGF20_13695, partial [Alphaproteobacteria bacterium]|nr:hypothetical protein [Alphaproteobacteria bacterium]
LRQGLRGLHETTAAFGVFFEIHSTSLSSTPWGSQVSAIRWPASNALQSMPGPSMKQPRHIITLPEYGVANVQHKVPSRRKIVVREAFFA